MRKTKRRVLLILITVITAAAVAYLGIALFFTKHFFFNTIINGENYSVSAVNSVVNGFLDTSSQYVLRIDGRDGVSDTITGADIALRVELGSEFEDIVEGQEALLWPASVFKETEYTINTMVTYSQEALDKKIDTLCFFESDNIRQPQDAYLSDYMDGGYQIIPEDKGSVPIREKIRSAVGEAISLLEESVDLDAEECYAGARITSDNRALQKECEERNRFTGVTVTYTFGEETEVLDGSIIKDWITVEDSVVSLDPELVREYVNGLSRKYDTWGRKREFRTTNGESITMTDGAYGWWMNRAGETQELLEQIQSGKSGERTPVYHAEAAQFGEDDIGDSYVEIDLTNQHLWVYKDGELVEETDFVSGNVSRGYNTFLRRQVHTAMRTVSEINVLSKRTSPRGIMHPHISIEGHPVIYMGSICRTAQRRIAFLVKRESRSSSTEGRRLFRNRRQQRSLSKRQNPWRVRIPC